MKAININLQIAVEDDRWQGVVNQPIESFLETYISSVLNHKDILPSMPKHVEVSVVLINDAEIKDLNREYRGKDKATNVLSFPQEDDIFLMKDLDACVLLGDIVLSIETIQLEAIQQQKLIHHHLAHLIVHGTLHLVGYDHEIDDEAEIMEALEINILQQHTIPSPYESDTAYMV